MNQQRSFPRPHVARLWGVAAWVVATAWLAWALGHPTVLFFDLGWGDSLAAGREFRGEWWRYEVVGETAFRWTGSEARVTSPLEVWGKDVFVEWRSARSAAGTTPVAVAAGGRTIATWRQAQDPRWQVRRARVGAHSGKLVVDVRASRETPRPHGIALDWIRVGGAERVWPEPRAWVGIVCLVLCVPGILALSLRQPWPLLVMGPGLLGLLGISVLCDTAAAVTGFAIAGPRAVVATALLMGVARALRARRWGLPEGVGRGRALGTPTVVLVLGLLALSSPRYHYPDVDTHGRYLSGIRQSPRWALDPRPYQQAVHAWTRVLNGERVGFPYSSAFHVASWPLAPLLGDVGAITTMACLAVGVSLLLVHAIGLMSGLAPPGALVAQVAFALLPVISSRLTLALWPSLLGQCVELALLTLVMVRPPRLEGMASAAVWTLALVGTQVIYVGELLNVSAMALVAALAAVWWGQRRWAARLLMCQILAGAIVLAGQHWYFMETLWRKVVPAIEAGGGGGVGLAGGIAGELREVVGFLGGAAILLAAGVWRWRRMSAHPRRVLGVVLGGAALLSGGRALVPGLLGDAKVVELLAMPAAILAAWGARSLWAGSWGGRLWAAAGCLTLLVWSVAKAASLYGTHAMVAVL